MLGEKPASQLRNELGQQLGRPGRWRKQRKNHSKHVNTSNLGKLRGRTERHKPKKANLPKHECNETKLPYAAKETPKKKVSPDVKQNHIIEEKKTRREHVNERAEMNFETQGARHTRAPSLGSRASLRRRRRRLLNLAQRRRTK